MNLKVIVDNNTYIDKYYFGEPALSIYIEDNNEKILFDVGYSDIFIKNMASMGICLEEIKTVVISHGHDDHTGGFKHLFDGGHDRNLRVIAHPDVFSKRIYNGINIGTPFTKKEMEEKCSLFLSAKPFTVTENLTFLGEIPEKHPFEKRIGRKTAETGKVDYLLDDTALVYKSEKGLFVITGCAHSGICNIIDYAKNVCGDSNIIGVIGGFHLFEADERLEKTIEYFKENNIGEIYPCHCTSFYVKARIHEEIKIKDVGVGLEINV